jgi:outer membrane protein TolC
VCGEFHSVRCLFDLKWRAIAFCVCILQFGCASWRGEEPVVDNPVVEHYRHIAEHIAFPARDCEPMPSAPSLGTDRPLVAPRLEERKSISLAQAIRISLDNNQIIRQNAQFLSPQNPVLANPDSVPSIFDPDIQNLGVQFGARGTEAALSDFDPRFSSTFKMGRDETGQNSTLQPGTVLLNDNGQSEMRLDQQLLSGGIVSLSQTWNYSQNNAINQLFPSSYSGALGAEFRQPLWQGAGTEFTAIAGPISQQARGFSFVNQGVVIARINNRLAEIDVEENLQNLVREIGDVYWDLYQTYREYESEHANAQSAKRVLDEIQFKVDIVGAADVAQAEDAFHEATSREEQSLGAMLQSETRLRRLLGLPITDGKLLYPSDLPIAAEVRPSRTQCLFEALINRPELRRQKTNLRSLELQRVAARNLANPRLDFVAGYSLNGFGQQLMSGGTSDGATTEGFNNAYASLLRGKETSWNVGFEYTVPLWLRSQRAQLHQLDFRIVKARRTLAMQEDEIARELHSVLQTMQRSHQVLQTNDRRVRAANRRVQASLAHYRDAGQSNVDPVLRAEMSLNQAKIAYYRSISEYNKALRDLLYRTGRLLSGDGIELLDSSGIPLHPQPSPTLEEKPIRSKPAGPPPKLAQQERAEEFELPLKTIEDTSESQAPSSSLDGTSSLPDSEMMFLPTNAEFPLAPPE